MKKAVNYENQKEFTTITQNVAEFNTACTSICFENKGTATVDLVLASGKGTLTIRAGEVVEHNNTPDTLENNKYSIEFAAAGTKNLFITKEHILRVLQGESEKLPSRRFEAVAVTDEPEAN
jgi:hypothetical protein